MMYKYLFVLVFVFAFNAESLFAQGFKDEFRMVNETYENKSKITMDIIYNAYESHESSKIVDTYKGNMIRNGASYFTKILDTETIYTDKYSFMLDKGKKQLIVANPIPFKKSNLTMVEVDESLKAYSEVKELTETGDCKVYHFKLRDNIYSEIESFDFHINKETHLIQKAVLFYSQAMKIDPNDKNAKAKKPRLEVLFLNININPAIDSSLFDYKTYISLSGKDFTLNENYNGYKLINQVYNPK